MSDTIENELASLASELVRHFEGLKARGIITTAQCEELVRLIADAGEIPEQKFAERVRTVYQEIGGLSG